MTHDAFICGLLAFLAFALAVNVSGVMIAETIRAQHPDIWESLGRPSALFGPLGFGMAAQATRSYILRGRFKESADTKLWLLCNVFRAAWMLGIVAFVVTAISLVLSPR